MSPTTKEYLALQSWMHLVHGRTREAITLLEGMAVLAPGDVWVHRALGYAYLRNQQHRQCLDHLNHCLASKSHTDHVLRVRALWGLGQREEARRLLQQLGGKLSNGTP